jgi:5-methylcytosine-specific restriction endonuclease McrA
MAITKLLDLTRPAKPLTSNEGRRILERDQYRCQYCGLDGMSSFENSLIMTVDFVQPRARKGKSTPGNLVTACRPCNVIKGQKVFADLAAAKAYVLERREELRKDWQTRITSARGKTAAASSAPV